jgi:hypothetical protein
VADGGSARLASSRLSPCACRALADAQNVAGWQRDTLGVALDEVPEAIVAALQRFVLAVPFDGCVASVAAAWKRFTPFVGAALADFRRVGCTSPTATGPNSKPIAGDGIVAQMSRVTSTGTYLCQTILPMISTGHPSASISLLACLCVSVQSSRVLR